MVECNLPKVEVAGSSPVSRCHFHQTSTTRPRRAETVIYHRFRVACRRRAQGAPRNGLLIRCAHLSQDDSPKLDDHERDDREEERSRETAEHLVPAHQFHHLRGGDTGLAPAACARSARCRSF